MNHNTRIHYHSSKEIQENLRPNTTKGKRTNDPAVMTTKELNELRGRAETAKGGVEKNAAVISRHELEAIKAATTVKTAIEKAEDRNLMIEQREQQRLAARQRKERMQTADRVRSAKLPKSSYD